MKIDSENKIITVTRQETGRYDEENSLYPLPPKVIVRVSAFGDHSLAGFGVGHDTPLFRDVYELRLVD